MSHNKHRKNFNEVFPPADDIEIPFPSLPASAYPPLIDSTPVHVSGFEEKTIRCIGFNGKPCVGTGSFTLSAGEVEFYATAKTFDTNLPLKEPKRCPACRAEKKRYKEENGGDYPASYNKGVTNN